MSAPADVSRVTRELLAQVRKMVPPLLEKFHKGQMGRVAVVGGSADYTGAPFFSAMASARLGADMSHVVCEAQAAQAIKTYSPNLMVHPLLRLSALAAPGESAETLAAAVVALLPRLHVLVVGPGLGRDRLMLDTCAAVIGAARARNVPLVLDADALLLAQTRPELVQGYRECVLTPNAAEFARLCASKGIADEVAALAEGERAARLARAFGGVLVVQKGPTDYISDGATTLAGDAQGCPKRSGGQGDTLTGCIATFLAWRRAYLDEIWDHAGDLDAAALLRLAAFGGSSVTRECSRLAFARRGRSLQAGDLTDEVAAAFLNLFGAAEPRL